MSAVKRGLLVALVQLLLVSSLGAVLLIDRARLPSVWVRTAPVDPDTPFRGRYVRLRVEVESRGFEATDSPNNLPARLLVEDDRLVAVSVPYSPTAIQAVVGGDGPATLLQPLAYFIPEHVEDPSRRPPGEELWVEVTVPRKGPPRPIRLGVKPAGSDEDPRPLDL